MARVAVADDGGDIMRTTDFGEILAPSFKPISVAVEIFKNLPNFSIRDDDIMLCTYMKTGTNWLFEILSMILNKTAKRKDDSSKMFTMIDVLTPEEIDKTPSPRILNSHFTPKYLPREMKTKKTKTVLCLRNPKDTCVSHYHHIKGFRPYEYKGKWENFVRPWVAGKFEYGAYSSYLNQWQTAIEKGVDFPLHVVYFEDLKLNGIKELNRLTEFLEVDLDDKLKQDIIDMCQFDKMKQKVSIPDTFVESNVKASLIKAMQEEMPPEANFSMDLTKMAPREILHSLVTEPDFTFYRKGMIGDWKNVLTVAQNEVFDEIWRRDIRSDTMFKFKYTQ